MNRFIQSSLLFFLCATTSSNVFASGQPAETFEHLTLDFVRMSACQMSWNFHSTKHSSPGSDFSNVEMQDPTGTPFSLNAVDGERYAFHTNAIRNVDVCGWFFIAKPMNDPQSAKITSAQAGAVEASYGAFHDAASEMNNLLAGTATGAAAATQIRTAAAFYRARLTDNLKAVGQAEAAPMIQAALPVTKPPATRVAADDKPQAGFTSWLVGANPDEAWAVRLEVAKDMAAFDRYLSSAGLPTGK